MGFNESFNEEALQYYVYQLMCLSTLNSKYLKLTHYEVKNFIFSFIWMSSDVEVLFGMKTPRIFYMTLKYRLITLV